MNKRYTLDKNIQLKLQIEIKHFRVLIDPSLIFCQPTLPPGCSLPWKWTPVKARWSAAWSYWKCKLLYTKLNFKRTWTGSVTNKKNYLHKLIYINDMQKHLLSYHSRKFVNTVQILKVARYHITHPNSKKISTNL